MDKLATANGDRNAVAAAVVKFVQATCVGFSAGANANGFVEDVADGCTRRRRKKPAKVQELARLIVAEPDHRGAARVLSRIADLKNTDTDFCAIQLDALKEFYEACGLKDFETAEAGFTELSHRRTYSRPSPPAKAISTVHKVQRPGM